MEDHQQTTIECDSVHPGFVVRDIAAATVFYETRLGFAIDFLWGTPPHFAAVSLGKLSVHLIKGEENAGKGFAYFTVENVDEVYRFHQQNGVAVVVPIDNRPYDMRDYHVQDLDGNVLGFGQYRMPVHPPLKIEREPVTIRLEKRLLALLNDLAVLKETDLTGLLEETLLHTFEPFGEGIASPHTKTQLRSIQELKAKHGIDYDVHASYRFVE